jgi:hypothetical protein
MKVQDARRVRDNVEQAKANRRAAIANAPA